MRDWEPASELRERGPIILGYRLRPLTLGHLEFLDELGIDTFGDWSLNEMLIMVVVLTQSAEESRRDIHRWWFVPTFWLLGWLNRKTDIAKEAEKLAEYLRQQVSGPCVMGRPGSKKRTYTSSPIHINLLASALSRLHLSLAEARTLTVRQAKQLVCAAAEAAGEADIASEGMLNFADRCRMWDAYQREHGGN